MPRLAAMLAPELEHFDATHVRIRGRSLVYFSGCDYFRLSRHPAVHAALEAGLKQVGLNVAASRTTTGNHPLYGKLEKRISRFFNAPAVVSVSSGYITNLVVAQALAGRFSHALLDERSHASLVDAAGLLECPIVRFKHGDAEDVRRIMERLGSRIRPVLLTDGMFSHNGAVAPLKAYLALLPADGLMLVDDAHGAGVMGQSGGGAVEYEGIRDRRIIQSITLSKAFGVYGGAILCSRALAKAIIERSRMFVGNTPLPLPLVAAALKSIDLLATEKQLRDRLHANAQLVKDSLRNAGLTLGQTPGPIIEYVPRNAADALQLKRRLLAARILPPFIRYPGGPPTGYFRFAISSAHTAGQLRNLSTALVAHLSGR